jgi:hypothetical protein
MGNFKGAAWRLAVFLTVCLLGTFALLTIFANFRFGQGKTYSAEFTNVSGLKTGNFVRIAGVEVGQIKKISVNRDATVRVEFSTDDSVVLTEGNRAAIRYDNLIGGRYLALEEGAGPLTSLRPGDTIPVSRTEPAWRLPATVSCAGPRKSQRAERTADTGVSGPGRHHRVVSGPGGRADEHAGRPRSTDRTGHRQPQRGVGVAGRPERQA